MNGGERLDDGRPPVAQQVEIADRELVSALCTLRASSAVTGAQVPAGPDASDTMIARIAWSRILEPGDGSGGALIGALGAASALKLLLAGATAERLAEIWKSTDPHSTDVSGRTLHAALERWKPRLDRDATIGDLRRAADAGLQPLFPEDEAWPERLDDLGAHAPVMLWVRGDPRVLRSLSLAVVGARAATSYGTHTTAELTSGVCAAGAAIVSGAAYGIDAAAHRAALAADAPTVAVLAGGVDRPYPLGNTELIERIARHGAVCAEVVPGTAPTRWRFLMRNRIVAALAAATLVTEAGSRSGSLNTAGHAAQLGRMLGAVPGPVTSAASAGCHRLIREYDASLVTSANEACELIGLDLAVESERGSARASAVQGRDRRSRVGRSKPVQTDTTSRGSIMHQRILDAIPLRGARPLESVVRLAGVSPGDARGALAELELLGLVEQREDLGGGAPQWALRRAERRR